MGSTKGASSHSLIHDSFEHMREAANDIGDIWRHEGLKRGVDFALYATGAHEVGRWALELVDVDPLARVGLETNLAGLAMNGPVGLGAGWDKTGKAIRGWQAIGASHITPGGISLFPQSGNRMPRLRTFNDVVGDHGTTKSLNSFGFYNPGARRFVENVMQQREENGVHIPIIVQVTANKEFYEPANRHHLPDIIAKTVRIVKPVADGIELGVTSPNTFGMRDAQSREFTRRLILAAKEETGDDMSLGYKGDADGGEERLDMYCELAVETGLNYYSLINTTALAKIKAKYGADNLPGGLAGGDHEYQDMAVAAVRYLYEQIGDRVDIMGLGGVGYPTATSDSASAQAIRLIRNGASAVGVNTGVRHLGARTMRKITLGIKDHLVAVSPEQHSLNQLIGIDTVRGPKAKAA